MHISSKSRLKSLLKIAEGILFDFDGTLFKLHVPWLELKNNIEEIYFQKYGKSIPSHERFSYMFDFINEKHGVDIVAQFYEIVRNREIQTVKNHGYSPLWLIQTGLNKIKYFLPPNIIFGIVSLNFHETINFVLKQYNLKDQFDIILGRDDVEKIKPDAEGILRILKRYELNSNHVLYIGDQVTDKEAAENSQIHFIYVEEIENML
jgi:HAD superfamily hydrolase (TIGR01549 family)